MFRKHTLRAAVVAAALPLAAGCGLIDQINKAIEEGVRSLEDLQAKASQEASGAIGSIGAAVGSVDIALNAVGSAFGGPGGDDGTHKATAIAQKFAALQQEEPNFCDLISYTVEMACANADAGGTQTMSTSCEVVEESQTELTINFNLTTESVNCENPEFPMPESPAVEFLDPTAVMPGSSFTINGTGFGDASAFSYVTVIHEAYMSAYTFEGVDSGQGNPQVDAWSDTQIALTMPGDASYGSYQVVVYSEGGQSTELVYLEVNDGTVFKLETAQGPETVHRIDGTSTITVVLTIPLTENGGEPTFGGLEMESTQTDSMEVGGVVVSSTETDAFILSSTAFTDETNMAITLDGRLAISGGEANIDSTYDGFSLAMSPGANGGLGLDMNGTITLVAAGPGGNACVDDTFTFNTIATLTQGAGKCPVGGELEVTTGVGGDAVTSTYTFAGNQVTIASGENEVVKTCEQISAEAAAACGLGQ